MSFSLQLANGDLALNGVSLATVEGPAKLQQDLVCAILTPLGFDELHPGFGSTLVENLINPEVQGVIGTRNFKRAATLVYAELSRICQNYQAQQIARNEDDAIKFGRYTLTPSEILVAVRGIEFTQVEDKLVCVLSLEVGTNRISIRIPVPEEESI